VSQWEKTPTFVEVEPGLKTTISGFVVVMLSPV